MPSTRTGLPAGSTTGRSARPRPERYGTPGVCRMTARRSISWKRAATTCMATSPASIGRGCSTSSTTPRGTSIGPSGPPTTTPEPPGGHLHLRLPGEDSLGHRLPRSHHDHDLGRPGPHPRRHRSPSFQRLVGGGQLHLLLGSLRCCHQSALHLPHRRQRPGEQVRPGRVGRLGARVDSLGQVTKLNYGMGVLGSIFDADNNFSSYSFDALHRLVAVQPPDRHLRLFGSADLLRRRPAQDLRRSEGADHHLRLGPLRPADLQDLPQR